ncbi:hypothetical protein [Variovorax sp. N23]|uniref:rolling circle replication-associated protein n=1 Tax=Variovorax sp. N23 TaxID=2980555 RepID=UPI0021CA34D0|nr:hypothetical protein [Variovorax sp. N23]MCU4119732.1 hypothetical protein [Variovorax sp. N23]
MPQLSIPTAHRLVVKPDLVRKTETSPANHRKRILHLKRKLARITKEHWRMAKSHGLYAVALTLTYGVGSLPSGKDVSTFLDKLRARLRRLGKPLLYAWVLECKRAYHYHLMLWLPRGMRLDSELLARWWARGHTQAEMCQSPFRWSRYMAKSETKMHLPPGQRLFGCGGLDQAGEDAVRRACLPRWLQQALPVLSRPRRCPGGGWVDVLTGELFLCPYVWTPRGIIWRPRP